MLTVTRISVVILPPCNKFHQAGPWGERPDLRETIPDQMFWDFQERGTLSESAYVMLSSDTVPGAPAARGYHWGNAGTSAAND